MVSLLTPVIQTTNPLPTTIVNSRIELKTVNLYYHVVLRFAPLEGEILESESLHVYQNLVGSAHVAGGKIEAVGGAGNHVHLLVGLEAGNALADFVAVIKLLSAALSKRKVNCRKLIWLDKYEAFTISLSQRNRVRTYIRGQTAHHQQFGSGEDHASSWQRNAVECS